MHDAGGGRVVVRASLRLAALVASCCVALRCTDFNGLSFPVGGGPADGAVTADAATIDGALDDGASDEASPCTGPHLSSFEGHCYRFTGSEVRWQTAESDCIAWGGHLVSISSEAEHQFLETFTDSEIPSDAASGAGVWIGLNDLTVKGTFTWSSNELVVFTAWGIGQPDKVAGKDCVFEYTARFMATWDNFQCSVPAPYVCER